MIEQRVTLRYGAQQIPAIVQAVQGDTGRDVIFELADYEIPAGATANYYIDKPDDTAIYNSAEVISSTEVLAHLTEQALAEPGRNNGQVRILSDGEVITSFDFVLEVEAFRGLMRMQSETEVNIFDEALQAAAEDAIQEILDQTPVVTGMQNSIAPSYSASSTYAVGDYVMYNAQLYRCITAITTAEAWTEAHWIHVPIASEVSDLKSALKQDLYENEIFNVSDWENGGISASTGENVTNLSRIRTKTYLPWGTTKLYSTDSNVRFLVYAYNSSGAYVGGWWGDGTFNPTDVKGVSSVDFNGICSNPTYAEYQFRACIYINNGTARVETITDVYIDNLPLTEFIKLCANLSMERVQELPENTDLDDLMTVGNYYLPNSSRLSTISNRPLFAGTGGRVCVLYTISNSRPMQMYIGYNSAESPVIYVRFYTSSGWWAWQRISGHTATNLRILGFNLGKFNYGRDGGLSENVEEKISNFKRFIGDLNPDIALTCECSTYIDTSQQYQTIPTIFTPLYNKYASFNECAVFANSYDYRKLETDGGVYLRDNNNTYAGQVARFVLEENGKQLLISGGFLRVLGTETERYQAFVNYLATIANYKYSIIYLDTNVLSEAERVNLANAASEAGYTICNGGYFGLVPTLHTDTMFRPIDNIFVKGNIKVKNFYVASNAYDDLSSDHYAVIADVTLY